MKQRILILLLCAALAVFGGCGGGGESSSSSSTSSSQSESDASQDEEHLQLVNTVYPASYTTLQVDYQLDTAYGELLYAAEGETDGGGKVFAVFVKGSNSFDKEGSQFYGYDSQIPGSYQMVIVIDEQTDQVVAYEVVKDGANQDVFRVPESKLETYKTVKIEEETAFDDFTDGLVTEPVGTIETVGEDEVITGTLLLYTGATVKGTYSGQCVRNCFMAAARVYRNTR